MMKNLIGKILAISSIGLLLLSSCKKTDPIVAISDATTKTGVFTTSTTTPVLDRANPTAAAITVTTATTNYGYNAVITYTLQVDIKGNNFANPVSAVLTSLSQTYSAADFNRIIIGLKKPGVSTQYEMRIQSSLSPTAGFAYSNVIGITATAFPAISYIYVVGSYQGYNTAAPDSLSSTVTGIYTGVVNFTAGTRFLILPAKNFANKYATITNPPGGTATTLTYATEFVTGGGNDLYAPTAAGYYIVTLNTIANTITVTQTNSYSVIGYTAVDAANNTNFSADVPLKYVNDGVTGWSAVVALVPGSFKIRQNNDWTFSWGIPKAGSEGAGIANTLNYTTNDNIPVAVAGNYKVVFGITPFALGASVSTSTPPLKTTTYSLVKQ